MVLNPQIKELGFARLLSFMQLIHQRFQLIKKPDNYIKKVAFYAISYKITCHHLSFHKNLCHMYSHYVKFFA